MCVPPYAEVYYYEMILCVSILPGARGDADAAKKFILDMFRTGIGERDTDIYTHFTQATDTNNIEIIFKCVKDHVLAQYIREIIIGL